MRTIVKGKNYEVPERVRDYAERKLGRLERLLDDRSDATVELSVEQHRSAQDSHIVDVTLVIDGQTLRSSSAAPTHQAGIDAVLDKIERRAVDHRETSRVRKSSETVRGGGRAELEAQARRERRGARAARSSRSSASTSSRCSRRTRSPGWRSSATASSCSSTRRTSGSRSCTAGRDGDYGLIEPMVGGGYTKGGPPAPLRSRTDRRVAPARSRGRGPALTAFDRLSLLAVVAVAALLRLPGIDARGQFDADQGHDMSTLVAFTRDGVVPLLGPEDVRRRVPPRRLLLLPARAGGGDLRRRSGRGDGVHRAARDRRRRAHVVARPVDRRPSRGSGRGPRRRHAARGLARGDRGVDVHLEPEPDRVLRGALARGRVEGAGRAAGRAGGRSRSGPRARSTQLHVLGVVFLDRDARARAARAPPGPARRSAGCSTGSLIVGVLFLPLLVHELQTGFSETRAVRRVPRRATPGRSADPVGALAFTLLRVVGWPLVGARDGRAAARGDPARGHARASRCSALRMRAAREADRPALARRDPRLEHDRARVRGAVAPAGRGGPPERPLPRLPRPGRGPPARDSGRAPVLAAPRGAGGAPPSRGARRGPRHRDRHRGARARRALRASRRTSIPTAAGRPRRPPASGSCGSTGGGTVWLIGLPDFKLPDAIGFPIEHAGGQVATLVDTTGYPGIGMPIVVVCDRLFEAAIGEPCGGPAEDALVASLTESGSGPGVAPPALVERFDASPRTSVSIYR